MTFIPFNILPHATPFNRASTLEIPLQTAIMPTLPKSESKTDTNRRKKTQTK
jgi:hypothetical protein